MFKSLLFFFIFFLLINFSANASHVAGSEITYRCIGNGQYEVTCIFYRDCFGINAPSVITCTVGNSCNFQWQYSFTLYQVAGIPIEITSVCPGEHTTCGTGNLPGVQKYIYRGTVVLGADCEKWSFNVSLTARNIAITTIQYPSSENLFISATLNNTSVSPCNNSPVFNNDPVISVCKDQFVCIDPGVFDPDGDSLVCEMTIPLSSDNNPITYFPGYSNSQPLTTNTPVTIDNTTGEICFTPVQQEISTIALLVTEYRNGIQIGQVKRDVIIFVNACAGNVPELSGFNGDSIFTLTFCAGLQNCLPIYSDDDDVSDSTTISWDHGIPTAAYYNSGGQHDAGLFCWQPALSDVSSSPHCFNATVKDNSCRELRSGIYQYCIYVVLTDSVCLYINSTGNINENYNLKIFPQPATGIVYIDLGNKPALNEKYKIKITDILGKEVYQAEIKNQITEIDSYNWTSGLHIVYLISDESGIIKRDKFIVLK